MSAAPEIARLAEAVVLVPPQPAAEPGGAGGGPSGPQSSQGATTPAAAALTLGTLARELRAIAAAPERWCRLVRFEREDSVTIMVEECASYDAWLVILPPGDSGHSCDCDVATMIAGEATEGAPSSAVLRPGPVRVHGQRHGLRGRGPGYSISLHARARRSQVPTQPPVKGPQ
jgi:hypothetical protein